MRHPHPRLHALPAADRRHLLRRRRRGHAGVERRRDRQGRLPRARTTGLARAEARRSPRHRFLRHRRPGPFGRARPPVPRPGDRLGRRDVAQALTTCASVTGGAACGTVIGCSGSFPGPDSPASCYLVEAERLRAGARPRQRRARRRCSATSGCTTSTRSCSRHLHADHCLDLCGYCGGAPYPPGRRRGRGSRCTARPAPPSGWRAPTSLDPSPGMTDGVRLPHAGSGHLRDRAVHRHDRADDPPVEAYGFRHRARRRGRSPTRATPARATRSSRLAPRRRPVAVRGVLPRPPDLPPELHLTGREAGEHAARGGAGGSSSPISSPVERRATQPSPRPRRQPRYDGDDRAGRVRARVRPLTSSVRVEAMARPDGRAARPAPSRHDPARLARPRGGLGAGRVRRDPGAVRRVRAGLACPAGAGTAGSAG